MTDWDNHTSPETQQMLSELLARLRAELERLGREVKILDRKIWAVGILKEQDENPLSWTPHC
jgi:hypothetical protein